MRFPREWRSIAADERATAAVEFALVVPVFMLIVFGMLDFTRAYYTQSAIAAAVREGARMAAVQSDPTNTDAQALVKHRVSQYVVPFGNDSIAHALVSVQMLDGNGADCAFTGPTAVNQCVNVRVRVSNYSFRYFTPISRIANGGSTTNTITREAIFRFERNGTVNPTAPPPTP
ncbi:MAG: TadE/TadG family type IV pilus assembly protein [Gemmatimonadaceae bacterium]